MKTTLLVFCFCCSLFAFGQTTITIDGSNGLEDVVVRRYAKPGNEHMADQNYENYQRISATAWTASGFQTLFRSFMKFDLNQVPAESTIISAVLYLYSDPTVTSTSAYNGNSQLSGSNAISVFRVVNSWNPSTITWNNAPSVDVNGMVNVGSSTSATENRQIDLTSLASDWLNNPTNNYGISFRLVNEVHHRSRNYASTEHPNTTIRPKLVISYTGSSSSDSDCSSERLDSAAIVNQPWFGNNAFLENYIANSPDYSGPRGGVPVARAGVNATYNIPIYPIIYRNSDGTNQSIDLFRMQNVIQSVNQIYLDAGTGIRFYINSEPAYINNTNYNTDIDNHLESSTMMYRHRPSKAFGVHFIHSLGDEDFGGRAQRLFAKYNNALTVGTRSVSDLASTLAHELGHNLDLDHTHDPGRYFWGLSDRDNGDLPTCFQESVSRTRKQGALCVISWLGGNPKKCEVNSDRLCDTLADPGQSGKVDTACVYTGGGKDHWDAAWDPMTDNVMSYSRRKCRLSFTPMQIAIMDITLTEFLNERNIRDIKVDQFEPNNYFSSLLPTIALGNTQKHVLTPRFNFTELSDIDITRFTVTQTDVFRIETAQANGSGTIDTRIKLWRGEILLGSDAVQNLTLVRSDDNSGAGSYSKMELQLTPGDYFVEVEFISPTSLSSPGNEPEYLLSVIPNICNEFAENAANYTTVAPENVCEGTGSLVTIAPNPYPLTTSWSYDSRLQLRYTTSSEATTSASFMARTGRSGPSWVRATISNGLCTTDLNQTSIDWVGIPPTPIINGPSSGWLMLPHTFETDPIPNGSFTSLDWMNGTDYTVLDQGISSAGSGMSKGHAEIRFSPLPPPFTSHLILLMQTNDCGSVMGNYTFFGSQLFLSRSADQLHITLEGVDLQPASSLNREDVGVVSSIEDQTKHNTITIKNETGLTLIHDSFQKEGYYFNANGLSGMIFIYILYNGEEIMYKVVLN
ncbi:DNRLRE domain-containing protein [Fulvivirga sp. M361]|uniref:DNRLRE domain-containing protein n=1 Tax=Fulvivirga sp. M361 TaxID=2594266 RepID=UPI00117B8D88|nr:DNRLRE domain-containing protein [Fulvivirga sp. M361]TRX61465.1 DNRLRE domain-containing protein [Fulvivirga sp. M361]